MTTLPWINGLLGLWLIVAPFVLRYSNVRAAMWNEVIVGILVAIFAGTTARAIAQRPIYRREEQQRKAA